MSYLIDGFAGKNSVIRVWLRDARFLLTCSCLAIVMLIVTSCRRQPERPRAAYAPVAQIEQSFGRLIATANVPTPEQNGTGDRLGLFRDNTGTIWGIPLTLDEHGNLLGCVPPMLREAPVTDKLPVDAVDIVGAANEPTGWRGGTGKLELLFRDPHGGFHWQSIAAGQLKNGPVCWSQSAPVQPLPYYRLVKAGQ